MRQIFYIFIFLAYSSFSFADKNQQKQIDNLFDQLKTAKDSGKTAAQIEEIKTLRDKGKKAHDEGSHEMSEIFLKKALTILKG